MLGHVGCWAMRVLGHERGRRRGRGRASVRTSSRLARRVTHEEGRQPRRQLGRLFRLIQRHLQWCVWLCGEPWQGHRLMDEITKTAQMLRTFEVRSHRGEVVGSTSARPLHRRKQLSEPVIVCTAAVGVALGPLSLG